MLTEFEVRQRMDAIREARLSPLRKARLLLRIGRSLDIQAKSLESARTRLAQSPDQSTFAGIRRMSDRTERLHDDVRLAALDALRKQERDRLYMS